MRFYLAFYESSIAFQEQAKIEYNEECAELWEEIKSLEKQASKALPKSFGDISFLQATHFNMSFSGTYHNGTRKNIFTAHVIPTWKGFNVSAEYIPSDAQNETEEDLLAIESFLTIALAQEVEQ